MTSKAKYRLEVVLILGVCAIVALVEGLMFLAGIVSAMKKVF